MKTDRKVNGTELAKVERQLMNLLAERVRCPSPRPTGVLVIRVPPVPVPARTRGICARAQRATA